MEPDNQAALLNKGVALSLAGEFAKADLCLRQATALARGDLRSYYALVENSARAGDQVKAESYARRMLDSFPVQTIIHGIELYVDNYKTAPIAMDIIVPVLEKAIIRSVQDIESYSFKIQNN
jgi:Flp pilus assembly protein TadD